MEHRNKTLKRPASAEAKVEEEVKLEGAAGSGPDPP